jgi:hypothetical protein
MYAIVGWQFLRYAQAIRAVVTGEGTEFRQLLVRQRALWLSVACAAVIYIAIRVAGTVLVVAIR